MNRYASPMANVVSFDVAEIILTSLGGEPCDNETDMMSLSEEDSNT